MRIPCALGRSGVVANKREGDGATPRGQWLLRRVLYNPTKTLRPATSLSVASIHHNDGWCDASNDRNYNRLIRHPYPASAEHLWRKDDLYDVIVVLGYNDVPRVRGRGSAIFLHVARPQFTPTEGCIAIRLPDLKRILRSVGRGSRVVIDV